MTDISREELTTIEQDPLTKEKVENRLKGAILCFEFEAIRYLKFHPRHMRIRIIKEMLIELFNNDLRE